MTRKILLSLLSGMVILSVTWVYQNYAFSLSVEDGFFKKFLKIKRTVLDAQPPKKAAFVFINTGKDLALVEDTVEFGNVAVTDRTKLASFLQKLNRLKVQPSYTVLDLQFYYPFTADPSADSILARELPANRKLVIPLIKDENDNYKDPLFLANYAYSDYITYGSGFNKFRILNHSPVKSLPILMHEKIDGAVYQDRLFYALCNRQLSLSALWPHYYLSDAEVRKNAQTAIAQYYNLGEILLDMETSPEHYEKFFENRILIVGNFETDIHSTPIGKMTGPVIIANIYLSLLNGKHIVSPWYLLTIWLVLSALSYTAWFSRMPRLDLKLNFIFSGYLRKFIQSYISYFGCLFGLSLLALFVFDIQVALFLPSLILSGIEYVSNKRYLPEAKRKKEKAKEAAAETEED